MSIRATRLIRASCNLLGSRVLKKYYFNVERELYSPISMGMNGYLNAREYIKSQFLNVDNVFRNKMREFVDKDSAMIFTEDLKTMAHLVEKNPEDIELLLKMMKKFHLQSNLRFGSYIFGTVAMRAFYHLDLPDVALQAFKDPELTNFFDQIITYQLLLDMLYNHGKFKDVRDVYDIIKTRNVGGTVHPKNSLIITLGACYKENTKESFQYATELFKELQTRGYECPRRALTFLAALALRQDAPHIAFEIVSICKNVRYIDVRCIKLLAYCKLKRFDEMLLILKTSLLSDSPNKRRQSFFKDVIEEIEKALKEQNFDENSEYVKMVNQLKLHDFIQPTTLDENICKEIEPTRAYISNLDTHNEQRATRNYYSYQRMNSKLDQRTSLNPSLKDMI